MATCEQCGGRAGFLDKICSKCMAQNKRDRAAAPSLDAARQRARQEAEETEDALNTAMLNVTVTTAHQLEGWKVNRTIDVVTAECVFGMNLFRDFFASVSDVFGGRNKSSQKVLKDARTTCLNELRREAALLGGNAIIAVDLDYNEFSGAGKSMLFLVASGTAVIVEPT